MTLESVALILTILGSSITIVLYIIKLTAKITKLNGDVDEVNKKIIEQNKRNEKRDETIQELRDEIREHIYSTGTAITSEQSQRAMLELRVSNIEKERRIESQIHELILKINK